MSHVCPCNGVSGAACVCLCVFTRVCSMLAREFILYLLLGMCVYFCLGSFVCGELFPSVFVR